MKCQLDDETVLLEIDEKPKYDKNYVEEIVDKRQLAIVLNAHHRLCASQFVEKLLEKSSHAKPAAHANRHACQSRSANHVKSPADNL
ncbi:hypothetical protein ACTXT7_005038 [Hymenolepis weldensis]